MHHLTTSFRGAGEQSHKWCMVTSSSATMEKLHSHGYLLNSTRNNRKLMQLNRLSNNQVRHRNRRKGFAFCYLAMTIHWRQLTCRASLLMSHRASGDDHRGSTTTTRSSVQFVSRESGINGVSRKESKRKRITKSLESKCGIRADTVHLTVLTSKSSSIIIINLQEHDRFDTLDLSL